MTDQPRNDIEARLDRARLATPRTLRDRLAADIAALLEQHERETIAARALAGDPNPTDADPLDYIRTIADNYTRHRDLPDAESMYLDLAAELTLDDARAIRLAAEAVAKATPRLIRAAKHEDGKSVPDIATALDVTESYVYRVLREQRAAQAAEGDSSGHDWHHPTPSAGLRCRRCDLAHKQWSGEDCPAAE